VCAARVERADHGRARAARCETAQVRAILHQRPRTFQPASIWPLKRLTTVGHEQGLRATPLSGPTMLATRVRLGVPCCAVTAGWQGAPRAVTRLSALFAAARRSAISTKNPWEVTWVAANDGR
jgi:hypothetical protein